ncbi:class I SAM-dependent methyltransferase [Leptodesmis sp.]|uniref:class I SAM-dependent methyltransferase n=1 Tax=Leptodesmis sp. TaxID=3100501 RepID=UPI0040535692
MVKKNLQLEPVCCGVCSGDQWHEYAQGKDYEYNTSDDVFQIVECQLCGNIYLNPRPTKSELSTIYPPNYYAYNYNVAINPIAVRAKDWLDKAKVKQWLKHLSTPTPRFLDVGCGNGRYLRMLYQLGVPKDYLYGVEMNDRQIEQLKADGFHGYYGRIEDVEEQLPAASFDLIVLLQVLEHVENPRQMMASLTKLLAPGGILIVETPNTKSWDAKLFRRGYWGGYHIPRHWNLLNAATLKRLANEQGLDIKTFNFLPAHSFWIFSFHHWISDRWKNKTLADWFNPYQNLILLTIFTGFDLVRAKLGFSTSNIQMVALKPYSSVARE